MLTFLAEHNDMETWCTDIGNAYLESYTQEKVYIKAGPEFGDREGHTLIIVKALYGLKSSDCVGMNVSLTYYDSWDSLRRERNPTFGCAIWATTTSI